MVLCKHYFVYFTQVKIWPYKAFNLTYWSLFDRTNICESSEHFFQKVESSLPVKREKEKISNNLGHITLEFYNVLVQV